MNRPVVAVVVAAGSGTRLGGGQPKALRLLAGVPLVTRSLRALEAGGVTFAVVVTPSGREQEFERALDGLRLPWRIVPGGEVRQDSVRRGLAALDHDNAIVLVHDAARPLVPASVVAAVVAAVRAGAPAVIPVVPVIDTIRQVDGEHSRIVDRAALRAVQTPQGFDLATLMAAHQAAAGSGHLATDDAALCELAGHPIALVAGARESLKITEPVDLAVAELLLAAAPEVSP